MAKFIIEVEDNVVKNIATPESVASKITDGNPIKAFALGISASIIEKEMDNGTTEFIISKNTLDDKVIPMFEGVFEELIGLAATTILSEKKKEKENEEEK